MTWRKRIVVLAFSLAILVIWTLPIDEGGEINWRLFFLPPEEIRLEEIRAEIKNLPLRKKIGSLMIFGWNGTTTNPHIESLITDYNLGGVNLLRRNIGDEEDVRSMTSELRRIAKTAHVRPLFIATDQEGGEVVRFRFLEELTPESEIHSVPEAFITARKRGEELRLLGVNMNFAPVIDYVPDKNAFLSERAFGTTTEGVALLGIAMANGYQASGVIPVLKHFPGYGGITLDPHTDSVRLNDPDFSQKSLEPFHKALHRLPDTPVMTAHIVYPSIDNVPATLSKKFLVEILRKEWGYNGVIITDDIEMTSAEGFEKMSLEKRAVKAIEAGADMIISTYTESAHTNIIKAIEKAVLSGDIPIEQINASVERVFILKERIR